MTPSEETQTLPLTEYTAQAHGAACHSLPSELSTAQAALVLHCWQES